MDFTVSAALIWTGYQFFHIFPFLFIYKIGLCFELEQLLSKYSFFTVFSDSNQKTEPGPLVF